MRPTARQLTTVLLAPALVAALCACESDGPVRPDVPLRSQVVSPASTAPDGLNEIRGDLSDQRSEARGRVDSTIVPSDFAGGGGTPWYQGVLDTLSAAGDFANVFGFGR